MKINLNTELNKEDVKLILEQYREFIFPVLSILVSIILVFIFLLPQIGSFSQKSSQRNTEMTKLSDLKSASNLVTGTDITKLDSNLSVASQALPTTKDFESILATLSSVGDDSNVTITDYNFQDGDFSITGTVGKIPSLEFSMDIAASPTQVIDFINRMYKAFPLSEVTSISGTDTTTSLSILFFYKPFSPPGSADVSDVRSMNANESTSLDQITQWSNGSVIKITNQVPVSSSSSGQSNSPF